ncbi:MAG: hypothetical protein AB7S50_08350 [Bacteroidales bacterium]
MNEIFKIFFYVPCLENNLLDQDKNWLGNFKKAFSVGLTQIVNVNAEIDSEIYFENEIDEKLNKKSIVIQLILNDKIELDKCIQHSSLNEKINKDQFFQIVCYPFIGESLKKDGYKTIVFYDENTNKPIKFDESLDKLKDDIWLKLLDISLEIKRLISSSDKIDTSVSQKKAVILASCTSDQNNNKLIIEREIRQLGYTIYDPSNFINDANKLNDFLSDCFSKSILSIHIIGNTEFPLIQNDETSVTEFQNRAFVNFVNRDNNAAINRLVWIPPDLKPKSERQKLYIESFMHQVEAMGHTEIIQAPVEVFKSIIQRKLNYKTITETAEKLPELNKSKTLYIIHKEADLEKAKKLKTTLSEKGLYVLINNTTLSNIESIRMHQQNLVLCDAVLILYTDNNRLWLNSKISDILKAPGIGRKMKYSLKALIANNISELNAPIYKDFVLIENNSNISENLKSIVEIIEKYDNSR